MADAKWTTKWRHRTLLFWVDTNLVGNDVQVILTNESVLIGTILEVDIHMNLVLATLEETVAIPAKRVLYIVPKAIR